MAASAALLLGLCSCQTDGASDITGSLGDKAEVNRAADPRREIDSYGDRFRANPRDTKDYPEGVWTLPPTYELGDKDHDKYAAIGESDRFTMRFVKPAK